jgi:hypothetical protein
VKTLVTLNYRDFVYVRLKGLIWATNGLRSPSNIEQNAGKILHDVLMTIHPEKSLVVDCKGVSATVDHSLDAFFKNIPNVNREIVFSNISSLEKEIKSGVGEFCQSVDKIEPANSTCLVIRPEKKLEYSKINSLVDEMLTEEISRYIKGCFGKFKDGNFHFMHSTPFFASGLYNSSIIISDPIMFYWTCIKLSNVLEKIIDDFKIGSINNPIKLLSVSLRGSPFAVAMGLLTGKPVETIDHLGPKHKLFDSDVLENIKRGISVTYIYIGDFTFGGTEIKIAKAYAELNSCSLDHAIVLGSLHTSEMFDHNFKLHPLANLNALHPDAKFTLSK